MPNVVVLSPIAESRKVGATVEVSPDRGRALLRSGAARPDTVDDARALGADDETADTQVGSPAATARRSSSTTEASSPAARRSRARTEEPAG